MKGSLKGQTDGEHVFRGLPAHLLVGRGPCQSDEGSILVVICLAAVRAEAVARADDRHHIGAHRFDRTLIEGQLPPRDARPLQQLDGTLHVVLGAARLEEVLGRKAGRG